MTAVKGQSGQGRRLRSDAAPSLETDRARALALTPVSRETAARLDRFVELLIQWQARMNLIGASTVATIWTRHIADSLQLLPLAPNALTWADLGSGAGFPGLIIACALAEKSAARVHLIESNAKKATFLREAARVTGAPAVVHAVRIEDFVENFHEPIEIVTARALSPLVELLAQAYPLLKKGAHGIFPKGQDIDAELTEAAKCWSIDAALVPSRTNPRARIAIIKSAVPINQLPRAKSPQAGSPPYSESVRDE